MMPGLRFAVLGPVRAWRGEDELPLGSPQQRAVLVTLLLCEGGAATADQLIDAVWGAEPPPSARATVRTYVSRLRQVLGSGGEPLLGSAAGLYRLRVEPGALDIASFADLVAQAGAARQQGDAATAAERLHAAAGLWHGEPLNGVPGPYADAQRAHLERVRHLAAVERLTLDIEIGRHTAAMAELTALVEEQPFDEGLRRLLMVALYQAGRPAAAVAQYHEIRTLLADELGLDPGGALQELYQQVLVADPALTPPALTPSAPAATPPVTTASTTASTTVAAPRVAPAQMPADITDFTGRAALLMELTDALGSGRDAGSARAIGLTGLPGVGTSALAIHVAHRLRDRFPDGQLYVDLRGDHGTPVDPVAVLGRFLRAFAVEPAAIPDDLHERTALWRSITDGRHVLVVLDHAHGAAQVRHLLPAGSRCATVVTADRRLPGLAGVVWRTVPVFDADESLELLRCVAGAQRIAAEPDAARRLATSCSHVPLAVRVAAERLSARPTWSVAEIEDRLRVEIRQPVALHADCDLVEAPLERRYNDLDPQTALAFCLASLADGADVTAAEVAGLAVLPLPEAERLMEELVDVHLVESVAYRRYRYHSLIRWFARRKAVLQLGHTITEAGLDTLQPAEHEAVAAGTVAGLVRGHVV
ncbi:hypothetical protein Pph01_65710 [Planotetraspora phitsanulokensis]|uniref:OmpR/PhoB-type domain-containing protein n=2 Tax=Planotetraspora phitsanulokensis TaxID=575192 RepID=A0A8J3XMB4_9ACTN|nr:hypothetical protein Pph01_65710 [Planotetraspora phitsanulokensis]